MADEARRYLQDLCSLGCIICQGLAEPHHVRRLRADSGIGKRPHDSRALPLCHPHHASIHDQWGDEDAFFAAHGVPDPIALAWEFWQVRKDFEALWGLWREVHAAIRKAAPFGAALPHRSDQPGGRSTP